MALKKITALIIALLVLEIPMPIVFYGIIMIWYGATHGIPIDSGYDPIWNLFGDFNRLLNYSPYPYIISGICAIGFFGCLLMLRRELRKLNRT